MQGMNENEKNELNIITLALKFFSGRDIELHIPF